jgi:soluble lytic murein transglycosylase-like protein
MPNSYLVNLVAQAEARHGLPGGLLDRLVNLESSYNPNAYNSASGASGLTQIIPKFHPSVNNPFDPVESLEYTATRLRGWFDEFGDWQSSVAAWHAGETAVRRARAAGKAIPGTVDQYTGLPTAKYVSQIVGGVANNSAPDVLDDSNSDFFSLSVFGLSPVISTFAILGIAALVVTLAASGDE